MPRKANAGEGDKSAPAVAKTAKATRQTTTKKPVRNKVKDPTALDDWTEIDETDLPSLSPKRSETRKYQQLVEDYVKSGMEKPVRFDASDQKEATSLAAAVRLEVKRGKLQGEVKVNRRKNTVYIMKINEK